MAHPESDNIARRYTKPVENPLAFKDFLGIKDKMSDSTRITNMTSLASEWEMPNSDRLVDQPRRQAPETDQVRHAESHSAL